MSEVQGSAEGNRHSRSIVETLAACSRLTQSQDTPTTGPKPIRLQGCDARPAHYGLRGTESAFSSFSVFNLLFELIYIGELQSCFFFPFQFTVTGSLPHRCIHVFCFFFRFFFHTRDYRVLCKIPCVMQWVLLSYFINSYVHMLV